MVEKIPEEIVRKIMKRQCVFFIGAGLSIEAGLPSGKDLANELYKILKENDYKKPDNFTLPRISQDFIKKYNRTDLVDVLRKNLVKSVEQLDTKTFDLISKFKPLPKIVITTNYDRLLEKAIGEENYTPIFSNEAVGKYDPSTTNLFKIHGDVNRLENAVITENDIRDFEKNNEQLLNKIISVFQENSIIFLGFSVEDEHIRGILEKINKKLGDFKPISIAVTPDESNSLRLKDIDIQHINMEAYEFLKELLKLVKKKGQNNLPFKPSDESNKINPFSIYSTEYFPKPNRERSINSTFIKPIDFSNITESGNTIIEGHRGSGKSMILKYLSFEAQENRSFENSWDKKYIGVYVRFKNSLVNTTTKKLFQGEYNEWVKFFMAYVNLILGEKIISLIKRAIETKEISSKNIGDLVKKINLLFKFYDEGFKKTDKLKNLELLIKRTRNILVQNHKINYTVPPDFLEQLISLICDNIKEWEDKEFYMLIDEYDHLSIEQQHVVNTMIKNRSFSYKIAVKLHSMDYYDISKNLLEKDNDYTYVMSDRYDFNKETYNKYKNFVINVANKRLQYYGYNNKIVDLLPNSTNGNDFEQGDYSGLNNIIKLSSGIIRDFLELCKDMVYYSNQWIINGETREKLNTVIPNVQNTVIKIHSNILYQSIDRIGGFDKRFEKSHSDNVRILIDRLADIFGNILRGSQSKEKRTVTGIQIKNKEYLNETATIALREAASNRLIQTPYNPRRPKNKRQTSPHSRYRFHRLLCPRFELSLALRWPKEIDSRVINQLFFKPNITVREITDYYLENKTPITLWDFEGDEIE